MSTSPYDCSQNAMPARAKGGPERHKIRLLEDRLAALQARVAELETWRKSMKKINEEPV